MRKTLEQLAGDVGVRSVVITGTGERVFCGGYDLGSVQRGLQDGELQDLLRCVREFPLPTIAAVNGHAIGAGLDLACSCDLRIVRHGSKIGLPAVRLGAAYHPDGLERILGVAPDLRLALLTGELLSADAVTGFADQVVPADGLVPALATLVTALADASPAALEYMLAATRRPVEDSPRRNSLLAWRRTVLAGPDVGEARRAREEGRSPNFAPRNTGPDRLKEILHRC